MQESKVQDDYNEISIGSIIKSLWSWRVHIVIGTVIFGLAGLIIGNVIFPKSYVTSCNVSMQFIGIENWKNSDNSPFDPRQVISPFVLSEATAAFSKDKKYSDVQGYLDIEPIISPEIRSKMKNAEFKYYPTQFRISFTTKSPDLFSPKEKADVLYNIIESYKMYFKKEYGEAQFKDFNVKQEFLDNNEYVDIVNMFNLLIANLNLFIDSKIEKAGKFRSPRTGMSFAQIKENMLFVEKVQLNGVSSVIKKMNIAKDRDKLVNILDYNLKNLEVAREKKANEVLMALKLLETQKIVMEIPANGLSPSSLKNINITTGENANIGSLIKTAMQAENESKNIEIDMRCLKERIGVLSSNVAVDEKWEIYVKKTIQEIYSDLKNWTETLTQLDNEFIGIQINDVIKSTSAPDSSVVRSKNYYILILLFASISLSISIIAAFAKEQMKS